LTNVATSRFFRDEIVFEVPRRHVLPDLALRATGEKRSACIWSAGCASGEEPYTLKFL
jgi:chemotaxis protein methyltransferase CheR